MIEIIFASIIFYYAYLVFIRPIKDRHNRKKINQKIKDEHIKSIDLRIK